MTTVSFGFTLLKSSACTADFLMQNGLADPNCNMI
jgi:hypothetical protein